MAAILGWTYDQDILSTILSTRADIIDFTALMSTSTHDTNDKKKVIEHYLDIDAALSAWIQGLARKLRIQIS
jgi:hypothetical protein